MGDGLTIHLSNQHENGFMKIGSDPFMMSKKVTVVLTVLLSAFFLVGCGTTARTMSHKDAIEALAKANSEPKVSSPKAGKQVNTNLTDEIHEHPTYDMPVKQAWPIVRDTLSKFCDGKLRVIDEANFHLEAKNQNVWEGDTYVMVTLKSDQQRTVIEVAVRDYGLNRNIVTRSPRILDIFLQRLDVAMKKSINTQPDAVTRLQTLEDLKAKGLITEEEYRERRAAILGGL